MKGGNQSQRFNGYTIVEVMIVLAVSGVMFLIAANFVSGKQARTAFNQGTNAMAGNVQSLIQSVVDGQYTDVPFTCSVNSTTPRTLSFSSSSETSSEGTSRGQGTSAACTFLGELLQFNTTGATGSDPKSNYDIVYLGGAKSNATGGPQSPAANSYVGTAITAISNAHSLNTVSLTKPQTVPQALQVSGVKVNYKNGVTAMTDTSHLNFGIIQGFGSIDASNSNLYQSGAQTVGLIVNLGPAGDPNENTVYSATSVTICLTDGTRKSHVIVGENGSQLKATAYFDDAASNICG